MAEEKSPFDEEQGLEKETENKIIPVIALSLVAASSLADRDFGYEKIQEIENEFVSKFSDILPDLQSVSHRAIKAGWDRFKNKENAVKDLSINLSDPRLSSLAHDILNANMEHILRVNRSFLEAILEEASSRGWSGLETSRRIKRFFGMTPSQLRQTLSYEDSLRATRPKIPNEVIKKTIDDRADRLVNWRINLIATRLSVGTVESSKVKSWQVVEDQVSFPLMKKWVSVLDDVTTDVCRRSNGEQVPLNSIFSNGVSHPPAINPIHACRSSIILVRSRNEF